MFAVIFEVRPRADRWDDYLALARMLRPELQRTEGFLENTRYRSRTRDGVLLSLSLWRDEKAVIRWRTHPGHFAAQGRGRREILADYRLRVGEVTALLDAGKLVTLPAHRFARRRSARTRPSASFSATVLAVQAFRPTPRVTRSMAWSTRQTPPRWAATPRSSRPRCRSVR
jgi:heme-degrading monooxygenase HmoA